MTSTDTAGRDERAIHTATVIRLQVAHNALQLTAPSIDDVARDLLDIISRLTAAGETGAAEDVSDMRDRLNKVLPLVRAALNIARGAYAYVPSELRGDLFTSDTVVLTRFLEIPTEG